MNKLLIVGYQTEMFSFSKFNNHIHLGFRMQMICRQMEEFMVLSPGTFWITSAKLEFSQQKTFKLWYRSSLTSLYQLAVLVCLFLDSITVEENTSKYNFYILVSFILWNRDDCYPRKYFYLSKCNWTRTQNHLVGKWTLNHLTKLAEHYIEFYIEHYIWRNWPNGWGFIYELSGFGFESSCSHFHGLLLFISVFLGERGTRQKFNIKSLLK